MNSLLLMLLNQGIQKQSREQIQDQIDVFPDVVSLLIAIRSLLLSSCPFLLNDRFKCNYGGKAGLTAVSYTHLTLPTKA